jgi:hypothetical protein
MEGSVWEGVREKAAARRLFVGLVELNFLVFLNVFFFTNILFIAVRKNIHTYFAVLSDSTCAPFCGFIVDKKRRKHIRMDRTDTQIPPTGDDSHERRSLAREKEEMYRRRMLPFGTKRRAKPLPKRSVSSGVCCSHICDGTFRVCVPKRVSMKEDEGISCTGHGQTDYACEICYLKDHPGPLDDLMQSKGEFDCVCTKCGTRQPHGVKCVQCGIPFTREIDTSGIQGSIGKILGGREPESQSLAMKIIQGVLAEYVPKRPEADILEDMRPMFATYRDERKGEFGCKEYTRGCHVQCPECKKFVCCRLCHDRADTTHMFRRQDVENMRCRYCGLVQPVAGKCSGCRAKMSEYYCNVCHLFDCPNARTKIFHCDKCGECRKASVDKVIRHCDACGVCVFEPHKCFKYSLKESTCSICGEGLFSAREQASFPPCGHWTHRSCLERHVRTSWSQQNIPTCPLCRRAVVDLTKVDQMIDRDVALDVLPEDFRKKTQTIVCNECGKTSTVPFHYKFRKCPHCKHYNTQLK